MRSWPIRRRRALGDTHVILPTIGGRVRPTPEMRAALRPLARRPGLSATIILTLALAIGANSAIFSAVDAVLLQPLPFPSADRLVAVYERNRALRQATQLVAPGRLEEWNARNHTFDGLAAMYFENMTDTTGALPERVAAMRTSPRFFAVLGAAPALGRTPTPEEERFGGPPVAVVSDAFWRDRLNGDPSAAGRKLILGGVIYTIIGVMPAAFRYPTERTEVWLPTRAPASLLQVRTARLYTAFGRMKPGVTIDEAQADLDGVQARLGEEFPQTDRGWGSALVPMKEEQIGGVRRSLWLLLGAVALVLLAACGNVACLMLADAVRREQEIAIRFALGARRRPDRARDRAARWRRAAHPKLRADAAHLSRLRSGTRAHVSYERAVERARGRGRPAAGTNDRAAECLTRRGIVRVQPARTRRPHHSARRIPDRRTRSIREDLRHRTVRQRRLFPDAAHSHSRGRHLQQRSVDAAVLESARHPRVRRSLLPLGESHRSRHDVVRHAAGPPRRERRRRWRRD